MDLESKQTSCYETDFSYSSFFVQESFFVREKRCGKMLKYDVHKA